jgi:small subunit ribosomal protein S21
MKPLKKDTTSHSISKGGDKHTPVQSKPLEVKVHDNFDRAMKIFRNMVQKERVVSNYKEKQSFEKPSDKKRRKRNERKRKALDLTRRDEYHTKQKKRDIKDKMKPTKSSEKTNGN